MSEWISIKDRLPGEKVDVLLYWDDCEHMENGYVIHDKAEVVAHCLYDGEQLSYQPTHWMPLPKPPQE